MDNNQIILCRGVFDAFWHQPSQRGSGEEPQSRFRQTPERGVRLCDRGGRAAEITRHDGNRQHPLGAWDVAERRSPVRHLLQTRIPHRVCHRQQRRPEEGGLRQDRTALLGHPRARKHFGISARKLLFQAGFPRAYRGDHHRGKCSQREFK